MADDWFRNEKWNTEIEKAFFDKLKRARQKGQYLRIQAYSLINTHPEITLKLLDGYFAHNEHFDYSLACAHKAEAHIQLGNIDAAIAAYEEALAREEIFPGTITNTYIDLPFLIATRKLETFYTRGLEILNKYSSRLTAFPINFFMWHAAQAIILNELHKKSEAKAHALKALEAADKKESEFRHHRHLGLVGTKYDSLKKLLAAIAK